MMQNVQCKNCKYEQEIDLNTISFCKSCGFPTSSLEYLNSFGIFGAKKHFDINKEELESRFYSLSRILHPDKHVDQNAENKIYIQKLYAFLTTSYQKLKDNQSLLEYLLDSSLKDLNIENKKYVPTEIAEEYFELTDEIESSPELSKNKISSFLMKLLSNLEEEKKQIITLAKDVNWDNPEKNKVLTIKNKHDTISYLESLVRTIKNLGETA